MTNSKPDFFIVGAPKCGTTAFNEYLNEHPNINMIEKELHYWGSDLVYEKRVSELEEIYFKELENKFSEGKLIGEGAVWYLSSEKAAKELKEFAPKAKVLIFLRNPTEAIYSLHSNMTFNGNEPITSFERALKIQKERETNIHQNFNCPTIAFQYQKVYSYSEQIQRYYNEFGKENVKIILFESFLENKQKTYNEVLSFLELNNFTIDFKQINANKERRSNRLMSLIFSPKSMTKMVVRNLIPIKPWRESIKSKLIKSNTKISKRTVMNSETNQKLKAFFKSDIELLEKLIDADLSNWK